jgi:hypothetical protein
VLPIEEGRCASLKRIVGAARTRKSGTSVTSGSKARNRHGRATIRIRWGPAIYSCAVFSAFLSPLCETPGSRRTDTIRPRCPKQDRHRVCFYQIIAPRSLSRSILRSIVIVNCPLCKSRRIHQSRRRGVIERIVAMLSVRPFRCGRCDSRFFRWSFTPNPNSPRPATTC